MRKLGNTHKTRQFCSLLMRAHLLPVLTFSNQHLSFRCDSCYFYIQNNLAVLHPVLCNSPCSHAECVWAPAHHASHINNMLTTLLAAERALKERGVVAPPEEEGGVGGDTERHT